MKERSEQISIKCLTLVLFVCLLFGCSGTGNGKKAIPEEEELLSEISRLPMLYTVEAEVEVLVEGHGKNGTAEWKSVFGSRDIIVPVKANLKAGIDLSKMEDVEVRGDKVYVSLPDPVIEPKSLPLAGGFFTTEPPEKYPFDD